MNDYYCLHSSQADKYLADLTMTDPVLCILIKCNYLEQVEFFEF